MITYNVKLKFSDEEHYNYWNALLGTSMLAYNDISKMIFETKTPLSLSRVHALVYNAMREKYPALPAQSIVKIYKDAISNLRASKRKTCPIRKKTCIRLDKNLYSGLTINSIKLPSSKRNKRLKVDFVTYDKFDALASSYEMKDPLIFIKNNEIYLSIIFDVPSKPVKEETYLGIDLGIRRLYATSDGNSLKCKEFNALKRRIRYQKRRLQSKGTKSSKRKLRKLSRKESNVTKNFVHHICNEILSTDKSVIVMEDLSGVKKNTSKTKNGFKRTRHNNRISQIPFYMIRRILSYKAPLVGKRVETVSPSFTSQIDCLTGKRDGLRKGCRYYSSNGIIYDADWNAAINIMNRKHYSSFNVPYDGALNFEYRLPSTSQMMRKVSSH